MPASKIRKTSIIVKSSSHHPRDSSTTQATHCRRKTNKKGEKTPFNAKPNPKRQTGCFVAGYDQHPFATSPHKEQYEKAESKLFSYRILKDVIVT
jgi:hypothetical protein